MPQPEDAPREMTLKALALGLALSFVFGASNAYLGLKSGQTVAATIPAAVIAMALFRLPWMRGTIQEQNIARTAASVGEALVAGAIYTLPAFVLLEMDGRRLWDDLRGHYWEATFILLAGGLLGVLFIILLRRPLCVDAGLPWPESVASVEIVRASAGSQEAPRYIFGALAHGGLVNLLKTDKGVQMFKEFLEGFLHFPRSVVRHFDFDKRTIGEVAHRGGVAWTTPGLSPALVGIGYLIGPRLASINVAGGILAWWVLIPLLLFFDPDLARRLGGEAVATPAVEAYTLWYNVVRPIAVGAMLVAAANTMYSMRGSILESVRGAMRAASAAGRGGEILRTERDIPARWLALGTVGLLIPVVIINRHFTGSLGAALVCAVVLTITGFLLSAVGGYLVGLVGASNQPLSGLTLATLVITALMMLAIGLTGRPGAMAVLGVASVVACACSVSGSLIQDLKAGHLLEGTPWKMQVAEIVAVVLLAFFLLAPIVALHEANLATGGIGGRELPAPQAGLMAQLTRGIVGGQMAWGLLAIGGGFGAALLLVGARAPMLVAVGMYLPFETSSAIFVGGLIQALAARVLARRPPEARATAEERGTLVASGLVAGEAIVGILLAVTARMSGKSITELITGSPRLAFFPAWGGWLSLAGWGSLLYALIRIPARKQAAL